MMYVWCIVVIRTVAPATVDLLALQHLEHVVHTSIASVTSAMDRESFNTVVSDLMKLSTACVPC